MVEEVAVVKTCTTNEATTVTLDATIVLTIVAVSQLKTGQHLHVLQSVQLLTKAKAGLTRLAT